MLTETRNKFSQVDASLADIAIDVKRPPAPLVGCKYDGTTDDTQAFTNLISYAQSNNVPLYLPPGTCLLNANTITLNYVTIFGRNATIIQNKPNTPLFYIQYGTVIQGNIKFECTVNTIATELFVFGCSGSSQVACNDITIQGISFTGNQYLTAMKYSLENNGSGWKNTIKDILFYQCNGIEIDSRANGWLTGSLFDNLKFEYYDFAIKLWSSTNAFYQVSQNNFRDLKADDIYAHSTGIAYQISGSGNVYSNLVHFHDGSGSQYAMELNNYTTSNKMTWGNCVANSFIGGMFEGSLNDPLSLYQKNSFKDVRFMSAGGTINTLDNTKVENMIPSNFIENYLENSYNQLFFTDSNLTLVSDYTYDVIGKLIHLKSNASTAGQLYYHFNTNDAKSLFEQDFITIGIRYKVISGTGTFSADLGFDGLSISSSSNYQDIETVSMGDGTNVIYFTFGLANARGSVTVSSITHLLAQIYIPTGMELKVYDFYVIPNYILDFSKIVNNRVAKIKYKRFVLTGNQSFSYSDFGISPINSSEFETFNTGKLIVRAIQNDTTYSLVYTSGGNGSVTIQFSSTPATNQVFDLACVVYQ